MPQHSTDYSGDASVMLGNDSHIPIIHAGHTNLPYASHELKLRGLLCAP